MKFHFSPKKFSGVLIAAVLIIIFALYCSGRVGWFLLLVLLLSPLLSVALSLYCSKRLTVNADISHILLSKGDSCALTISVANTSFLPCPPIDIIISDNPHLKSEIKQLSITSHIRNTVSEKISFTAYIAGGSYIGIGKALFSDWFGICSFTLSKNELLFKIGIIPDIARQDAGYDLLQSVSDVFSSDRNDDTIDDTSLIFKGFPGYDYRQYEPGDPLKRINSKVSAKTGDLMVRLDEKPSSAAVSVLINPYMDKEDAPLAEAVLESSLGIVFSLIHLDFSVDLFFIPDADSSSNLFYYKESAFSEDDLPVLAEKLADHIFSDKTDLFLPEEISTVSDKTCIICSAYPCKGFKNTHSFIVSSGEWRHT